MKGQFLTKEDRHLGYACRVASMIMGISADMSGRNVDSYDYFLSVPQVTIYQGQTEVKAGVGHHFCA